MPNTTYLVSHDRTTPDAAFTKEDATEIAHALEVLPVGWLTLFDPGDVVLVDRDGAARLSLFATRAKATSRFAARRKVTVSLLPARHAALEEEVRAFERVLKGARGTHVQVHLSGEGGSPDAWNASMEASLKDFVTRAGNGDKKTWRPMLSHAGIAQRPGSPAPAPDLLIQGLVGIVPWEKNVECVAGKRVEEFRPYSVAECYVEGEAIRHAKFGAGYVTQVLGPERIEARFAGRVPGVSELTRLIQGHAG